MEQYNQNNLKVEVSISSGKKMTKIEQKRIKNFFDSIFPGISKSDKIKYYYDDWEHLNGIRFEIVVEDKKIFKQFLIDYLSFIQGIPPGKIKDDDVGFLIKRYNISEHY